MTKGKYTETMQEIKQTQVPKSEGAGVRRTIRAKHSAQDVYFLLTRASAQDETISFEALGVLTYLLSKPDDWEVMVGDLARRGLSRYKVYRALKELREAGYVKLEREYADGKITRWIYTVYEEKLLLEFQDVELQDVEIRDYTEYRDKQNTEKKPQAPRKQRAPDEIFDTIALHSFGFKPGDPITAPGRIAKISSWLKGSEKIQGLAHIGTLATAEQVQSFYRWYAQKNKKADAPKDPVKFAEHWQLFVTQQQQQVAIVAQRITFE